MYIISQARNSGKDSGVAENGEGFGDGEVALIEGTAGSGL
jgi:hypothetical protein